MSFRLCLANAGFDKEKNKCVIEIQGGLNIMRFFSKFGIDETIFWKAIRNIKNDKNEQLSDIKEIEVEIKNEFAIKITVDYHEYFSGADREEYAQVSVKMFVYINKNDMERFAYLWVRDQKKENNLQLRSYKELLRVANKI